MVTLQEVEKQLEAIGANSKFWGRAEIVELQHIIVPGEQIHYCLNGRYEAGFATFVATDQRLLIVDKKLFHLIIEDMRYDMISEVDFGAQMLSGTIKVCTPTKNLSFTTYKPKMLRQVVNYIQQRVMQVRHQYSIQGEPQRLTFDHVQAVQQTQPVVSSAPEVSETPYAAVLGNQAVQAANQPLPVPQRRNPYMNPPVLMRRKIGRFGSIGTPTTFP